MLFPAAAVGFVEIGPPNCYLPAMNYFERIPFPDERAKRLARAAIALAIKHNDIPAAKQMSCLDCGEPAVMYDHYAGYEESCFYKVQPVCRKCDGRRRSQNGQVGNGCPTLSARRVEFNRKSN